MNAREQKELRDQIVRYNTLRDIYNSVGHYVDPTSYGMEIEDDGFPPYHEVVEFARKAKEFESTLRKFNDAGGLKSLLRAIKSQKDFDEIDGYIGRFNEDLEYITYQSFRMSALKALSHKSDYVVELLNKKMVGPHEFTPQSVYSLFDNFLLAQASWRVWEKQVGRILSGSITSAELSSVYKAWKMSKVMSEAVKVKFNEDVQYRDYNPESVLMSELIDLSDENEELVRYRNEEMSSLFDKEGIVVYGNRRGIGLVYYDEDKDKVISMTEFREGDVIEVAKVQVFSREDLFSPTLREIAVELIPGRVYGYPMGNVMQYQHSQLGNAWMDFNPTRKVAYVRALSDIQKGEEIKLTDEIFS